MLKDLKLYYIYSSNGTKKTPIDFFTDCLTNSEKFDMGLGFFSSAGINVLSYGFASFISNGGIMRLYINQYVSEEDFAAFTIEPKKYIEDKFLTDFKTLYKILSERDEHFFNCLSYLISKKRIDIKIIIPKTGGIAHQKFGIFTDRQGEKVAFNGSLNFTANALMSKNIETISCTFSWKDIDSVTDYESQFNAYFNGEIKDVDVFSAKFLTKEITKSFPAKDIKDLLSKEEEFIKQEKYKRDNMNTEYVPKFPYESGPRGYQIEAYNKWLEHKCNGVFAMATGTGKTITSLNCVLEEYKRTQKYKVLILVPTIDLVYQWIGEIKKFCFSNIYIVNGETNWKKDLTELKNDIGWGIDNNFIIISTYASFKDTLFQKLINEFAKDDTMILIADEAHNVGSKGVLECFKNLTIKKRIALSATPSRAFDEEGTQYIEQCFNDSPPYCYSFSMREAIDKGYLVNYLYYPHIVYLNEEEMDKYIYYTRILLQYFDSKTGKFKEEPEVQNLLMNRKRIIHKAQDKYKVFEDIIDELHLKQHLKYCFVYAPEGIDYQTENLESFIMRLKSLVDQKYLEIKTNTFIGSDKDNKEKLRAFAEGKIDMLFAMKCLDEGVDVPRAEVGIFTSSTGNPRQFIQRRGRLLRQHKEKAFAYIYDMVVVPDYRKTSNQFYEMERSLVKKELMRVAYFADLSSNYNEAVENLSELLQHYELEISILIDEINK